VPLEKGTRGKFAAPDREIVGFLTSELSFDSQSPDFSNLRSSRMCCDEKRCSTTATGDPMQVPTRPQNPEAVEIYAARPAAFPEFDERKTLEPLGPAPCSQTREGQDKSPLADRYANGQLNSRSLRGDPGQANRPAEGSCSAFCSLHIFLSQDNLLLRRPRSMTAAAGQFDTSPDGHEVHALGQHPTVGIVVRDSPIVPGTGGGARVTTAEGAHEQQ